MKTYEFFTVLGMGILCLLLSIATIVSGHSNRGLQAQLQAQQEEINRGNVSQQVGTNILRDMANSGANNQAMKDVLTKNGYTLTPAEGAPGAAAASSPQPSASPSFRK
jgi:hypothetical protein